jgi:hypothetical protein
MVQLVLDARCFGDSLLTLEKTTELLWVNKLPHFPRVYYEIIDFIAIWIIWRDWSYFEKIRKDIGAILHKLWPKSNYNDTIKELVLASGVSLELVHNIEEQWK